MMGRMAGPDSVFEFLKTIREQKFTDEERAQLAERHNQLREKAEKILDQKGIPGSGLSRRTPPVSYTSREKDTAELYLEQGSDISQLRHGEGVIQLKVIKDNEESMINATLFTLSPINGICDYIGNLCGTVTSNEVDELLAKINRELPSTSPPDAG